MGRFSTVTELPLSLHAHAVRAVGMPTHWA